MAGVSAETCGGMWSVVENCTSSSEYRSQVDLVYIPTATVGGAKTLTKAMFALRGFLKIVRTAMRRRTDVFHLHVSEYGSVYRKHYLARIAKLFRIKVLVHLHGGSFFRYFDQGSMRDKRKALGLFSMADAIIVLGEQHKVGLVGIGVDGNKISVVRNPVEVPCRNGYSPGSKSIVYLGAVSRDKGLLDLLDAVSLVGDRWAPGYAVRIYGPLSDIDIEAEILLRGLQARVVYGGYLDTKEKRACLEDAEFAVLPSHFEVLPMFVLEAMSYGVPVLATRVGMLGEVIRDGVNGLFCEPGDAESIASGLQKLLSLDRESVLAMSKSAYETVQSTCSTKIHVHEVVALYRRMIRIGSQEVNI